MRQLKYREAISEGLVQAMERDDKIFITGIGVDYSAGIFGTMTEALKRFGPSRVFESPAMENALTGIAIGAATQGKRPVIVHARCDFSFLAMDQLFNLAAKWKYMYGGNAGSVPIVTRMIIGRGWGQGATHSQSLQSVFGHFPGMAVVMPSNPWDAKGLTTAALEVDHPTIILEYRSLYEISGGVSEEFYHSKIGEAQVIERGKDITIVASSFMVQEALDASRALEKEEIYVEVIDPRSIRPLDKETIIASIRKTGRLLVADTSWSLYGFAAEIAALAAEYAHDKLKCPVRRITLPDCPAPVSAPLEEAFYPNASTIVNAVHEMMGRGDWAEKREIHKQYPAALPY